MTLISISENWLCFFVRCDMQVTLSCNSMRIRSSGSPIQQRKLCCLSQFPSWVEVNYITKYARILHSYILSCCCFHPNHLLIRHRHRRVRQEIAVVVVVVLPSRKVDPTSIGCNTRASEQASAPQQQLNNTNLYMSTTLHNTLSLSQIQSTKSSYLKIIIKKKLDSDRVRPTQIRRSVCLCVIIK